MFRKYDNDKFDEWQNQSKILKFSMKFFLQYNIVLSF